ncbi:uncharacterized protein LOC133548243 [Nerophis ophidion]|uniref:uncharacterized protein LOC133548243 n=1 Tax=Nerophis ophidion TaxID=159077 RepID=UPI002ADF7721|nr:uncharacterized protein LOC133548243 [Nerophis ophidion]
MRTHRPETLRPGGKVQYGRERVPRHPVGGRGPPLLPAGARLQPLLRPQTAPVAPTDEGCQRTDHPVVPRIAAVQLPGGPQAGRTDGRGGLPLSSSWGGGVGAAGRVPGLSLTVEACERAMHRSRLEADGSSFGDCRAGLKSQKRPHEGLTEEKEFTDKKKKYYTPPRSSHGPRPHSAAAGGNQHSVHLAFMRDDSIKTFNADSSSPECSTARMPVSQPRCVPPLLPFPPGLCLLSPILDPVFGLPDFAPRSDLGLPIGSFPLDLDAIHSTRTSNPYGIHMVNSLT